MQNTIIAIDKIVTPLGLNLQDSNLRTKVPSKGALAYEQDTALLYYGNDSDWILLSAGGLSITGPTGPSGINGLSITGPTGMNGLSITGPTGMNGLSITGPTGPTGMNGLSITGPTGPSGMNGLSITGPTGMNGLSITGPTGPSSTIMGIPTRVPYYDAITGVLTDDANHTIDNSTNGNTNFEATDGSTWTSQLTANQIGAGLTFNNLTTATDSAFSANDTALNAIVTDGVTFTDGFNIGLNQGTYSITNLSNSNQTALILNDQQVYLGVFQGFSQQGTSIVMDDTMTSIIIQDRATGIGGNCGIFYNGQDSPTPYQIYFLMTDNSGTGSGSFTNTGNIFQFLQGGVYSQLIQQQGLFEVAVNDTGLTGATFSQNLTMNNSNVTLSFDNLTDGVNGGITMSDVTAQFNFTDGATFSDNLTEDSSHIQLTYQNLTTNIQTGINGTGSEAQLKYQDFSGGILSYTQVDGVQHTSNYTDGVNFQSQCTLDSGQALLAYAKCFEYSHYECSGSKQSSKFRKYQRSRKSNNCEYRRF